MFYCNMIFHKIKISSNLKNTYTQLLSRLLSQEIIHKEVREKGGAYSGGTVSFGGAFMFYSYRDPNLFETLDFFETLLKRFKSEISLENPSRILNEAKLGLFSDIDSPLAPCDKGKVEFVDGVTHELREKFISFSF